MAPDEVEAADRRSRGPVAVNSQRVAPQLWDRLEERRIYAGPSLEEVQAACSQGLIEALHEGYLPDRIAWAEDSLSVTVDYVYDPVRASRPL